MDNKHDYSSSTKQSSHDPLPAMDNIEINMPLEERALPDIGRSLHDRKDEVEIHTPRMNSSLSQTDKSGHESLPAVDEIKDAVVILLVGNKGEDKRGVVDSLTNSGKWKDRKIAFDSSKESGVRILTCGSPDRVIVDTTPLVTVSGRSPVAIARRWISRNCLRRLLYGKDVVVVCVVTCRVQKTCTSDMFNYSNCWVDIFGLIFKDHKASIMVLVNTMDKEAVPDETKQAVVRFVVEHSLSPKNITYSNLKKGDDSVRSVIEESIRQRKSRQDSEHTGIGPGAFPPVFTKGGRRSPRWKSFWKPQEGPPVSNFVRRTVTPIIINAALSQEYEAFSQKQKFKMYEGLADREKFGPWGPERVILFGRTGSGKSTLAQMLTVGKLDKENQIFDPSTGVRGGTKGVQAGVGRGWYVVDTPGFGESNHDPLSTMPTRQVEFKVKNYVRVVEGIFSHYIYVVRKDRLDLLERRLWEFFTLLFGQDKGRRQFTVVISNADASWVQENIKSLEACFKGCESFLGAEFPADEDDEEVEEELQEIRAESLSQLEESLAALSRSETVCKYGRSAKVNMKIETERAYWDLGIERSERIKFIIRGASMIFACGNAFERPFSELTNILRVNDNISLIPE